MFLRYLDDVAILAAWPEALAAGLGTSICALESLGMSLMPEKTQAAGLGGGDPPAGRHALLGHSELILEQMRRVDRTVRKWLRREFGTAPGRPTRPAVLHSANGGYDQPRGCTRWRLALSFTAA